MYNDYFDFYYNSDLKVMCILNKKNGSILTAIVHKYYYNDTNWSWQIIISSTQTDHVITLFMPSTYLNFEILGKIDEYNNLIIEFNGNDGNCVHNIIINRSCGYIYDVSETYGYLIDQFMGKDTSDSALYTPSEVGKAIRNCVNSKKTNSFFDFLNSKKSK